MDKRIRIALIATLGSAYLSAMGGVIYAGSKQDKETTATINALHREIDRQHVEVQALQKQNAEQADTIAGYSSQLEKDAADVAQLKQDLEGAKSKANF